MEFKQLEAFVAVVENKSFSEAARQLNLTQPTISAHINSLEQELNSRLLIRTTKKLNITPRERRAMIKGALAVMLPVALGVMLCVAALFMIAYLWLR